MSPEQEQMWKPARGIDERGYTRGRDGLTLTLTLFVDTTSEADNLSMRELEQAARDGIDVVIGSSRNARIVRGNTPEPAFRSLADSLVDRRARQMQALASVKPPAPPPAPPSPPPTRFNVLDIPDPEDHDDEEET